MAQHTYEAHCNGFKQDLQGKRHESAPAQKWEYLQVFLYQYSKSQILGLLRLFTTCPARYHASLATSDLDVHFRLCHLCSAIKPLSHCQQPWQSICPTVPIPPQYQGARRKGSNLHIEMTPIITGNCVPEPLRPLMITRLNVRPGSRKASAIITMALHFRISGSSVKTLTNTPPKRRVQYYSLWL